MKIISMKCPQCQGNLDIKEDQRGKFTTCPFCGTKFLLEEEQPNINQTINIKEVHIGDTGRKSRSNEPPKRNSVSPLLGLIISIIAVLIIFVPNILRSMYTSSQTEPAKKSVTYRTVPEDAAVIEFVKTVFGKPVAEITGDEYASIKYLKIEREPSDDISIDRSVLPWLFTFAKRTDESGKPVKTVKIKATKEIVEDDIQVFTGLEVLDLSGSSDIVPAEEYGYTYLNNLKNLHYYTGTSRETLQSMAETLYNPESIYGIGSTYANHKEDLAALEKFSKLKVLNFNTLFKDFAEDLTFLSAFPDLEELKISFASDNTWDLSGLSALTKLKRLTIDGFDVTFKNLNVFAGMPQLESIKFYNVKALKNLDFVKNMPNLKSLHVEDCPIINLNGLKDSLSLTELTLDGCGDLKDVSALAALTSLKKLDIDKVWNFNLTYPKLNKLTALSEVDIEASHLDIIAGLPSIKKLYIYETSTEYSFKPLLGMSSLTELELRSYNWAEKADMVECLSKLPKLKSLTFGYGCLANTGDYAGVFSLPQVTKIKIQPTDSGSSYLSLSMSNLKTNKVLKELDMGGAEIDNLDISNAKVAKLGEYADEFLAHFPKLKKLNLSHSHIENPGCVEKIAGLEELDISDNYVNDISQLLKLKKLKTLICDKEQIANLDLLPESVNIK